MTLAAIDIGSNAARLLIVQVKPYQDGEDYTKLNLIRIPVRLGFDVFDSGIISPQKEQHLIDTLKAYQLLMKIYRVDACKACATSAMRDAANGAEIEASIQKATGIELKILSGAEEANVIYETHIAEKINNGSACLYIDVGGGSTELTLFVKNKMVLKESFNIGTIRLLQGKVTEMQWEHLKLFVKDQIRPSRNIHAIGTGGNINKLFSLSKRKEGSALPIQSLRSYLKEFSRYTVEERMHIYGLREDRADVIVPALQIYTSIMRWSGCDHIYVPKIGLADGLIRLLHKEIQQAGRMPQT